MDEEVAVGWWCSNCEYFEQDDEINTEVEQCMMCGCAGSDHRRATVMATVVE